MWDNLLRVNWARLTHAYGWATDAPEILRNMISADKKEYANGWDHFWGSLNHQGDFYDSTVAAVPFLVEAAAIPKVPNRGFILYRLRDRWLEAPEYGGDPLVPDPPSGVDVPTPMLPADAPDFKAPKKRSRPSDDDDFDIKSYRPMDLCAWQTGRAIQAGRATYLKLLDDADLGVVAAAGSMLLLWPETRAIGKEAIARAVAKETNEAEQARYILEFGVYAAESDVGTLARWVAADQPGPVRAAAAIVWACLVNPAPLPKPAEAALLETSTPDSDVFAKVPWTGVLPSGVWSLPANADEVILRLANNRNNEIRWRAVQGLSSSFQPGKRLAAERVVPILIVRLGDDYNRIRNAASFALADQGERALDIEPKLASILTAALKPHRSKIWEDEFGGLDTDASNGGHAARLLATISARLTPKQRKDAIAAIERAAKRLDGPNSEYIHFHSMGIQAATFMREQAKRLVEPPKWTLPELWGVYAFPNREDRRLSMHECDRRLAEAYSTEPAKTIAAAIQVLTDGGDRSATIGAANWLMSTGPAAVPALDALDSMQSRKDDPYVQQQAQSAAKYIRESVQTPALTAHAVPHDVRSQLDSPDPFVRAAGAELAAQSRDASAIVPALERLLIDDEFVEVGIEGRFECEGRLFHWRRERRSPRASAIDALFAIDRLPSGDAMLTAMLAVAKLTRVICGATTIPHRFTIAQWRQAVDAAGGHAVADSRIRTARQQCRANEWLGHNGPMNCAAELAEVIRQLSGRLVPNR